MPGKVMASTTLRLPCSAEGEALVRQALHPSAAARPVAAHAARAAAALADAALRAESELDPLLAFS